MEANGKPSDLQSAHLPKRNSAIGSNNSLQPNSLEDFKNRARPKTSTNREEAKQYEQEGQDWDDIGIL